MKINIDYFYQHLIIKIMNIVGVITNNKNKEENQNNK
jgi:hypothetical protein